MTKSVPIAVFTYNRPHHTLQLLESLAQCSRLDECHVVIFSDAPRVVEHAAHVEETRSLVHDWGKQNHAEVIERDKNLGLARSIVEGVTALCEEYDRVIVLEDDFILHPFFLDFMLQSLDHYMDDERVGQVAGFTFPIKTPLQPDGFFLPLTTSWGWATWQRAWKLFSWDLASALENLNSTPELRARFDLDGAYPYTEMMRRTASGEFNSWAIRWYWHTFAANKLTIYPRQSLVWQNGFDETATHTTVARPELQASLNDFFQEKLNNPLSFPTSVQSNEAAFTELKNFLRYRSPNSFLSSLKKIWKRMRARLVK